MGHTAEHTGKGSGYEHVQHGRLHLVVAGGAALLVAGAAVLWIQSAGVMSAAPWRASALLLLLVAAILVATCFCFATLRVHDAGDRLVLRFGPLPLFRKGIRYADIEAVAVDRTGLIDGWGIHFLPGRGWTWNLWGRDCVRLTVRGRTLRVGTDEPHELAAFLRARTGARTE